MGIFEAALYQGIKALRQQVARQWWRWRSREEAEAERLAGALWNEQPGSPQYGAVIDLLGFTSLMKRNPTIAHVHLDQFASTLKRAVGQHPDLTAALFSDGAFIVSPKLPSLAEAAMEILYRGLISHPLVMVQGLITYGDFRLVLPFAGTSTNRVGHIHWAGQGVLSIGLKEKLLPKGAMIFLDKSVPNDDCGDLPLSEVQLLWSKQRTLDWTRDPTRQRQVETVWRKLHHDPPQYLSHVAATKAWLRARAVAFGTDLKTPRWRKAG